MVDFAIRKVSLLQVLNMSGNPHHFSSTSLKKAVGWAGSGSLISQGRKSEQGELWKEGFNRRTIGACLFVFAGYLIGARIGFALTFQPHPVSVLWPPNSILLGALLLAPGRVWPWLLLAALPAHLIIQVNSGVPLTMVLCWFVSNTSEALIGAVCTRALAGPVFRFDSMHSLVIFLLCGGTLGPFLSSFLDAAFVRLNGFGEQSYWDVWRMRFCSNIFAAVTFVPVIVTWGSEAASSLREVRRSRVLEAGFVFSGLVIVSAYIFIGLRSEPKTFAGLLYAPLPFLLWFAVRFGPTGVSTGILAVALMAIWGAVHGKGPFTAFSPEQNALSIQSFFVVVSSTLMLLATSAVERGRAEERFTKAFRSSPVAMLMTHLQGDRVIEVNERCEKLLGYSRDEILGQAIQDFNIYTSEDDRKRIRVSSSKEGGLHDSEFRLRTKDGDIRHTLVSADTEEINGNDCSIITIRDITDRKKAEEAQANLTHASRLILVGEMTAMIAHELNQPLGAILSNADAAEMLLERPEPPLDQVSEILADIRKNDLRASEVIHRIRALLSKREMEFAQIHLDEIVRDVIELVRRDAVRQQIEITLDLQRHLPPVVGDRVHLEQVILNLVLNGMDAMQQTPFARRRLIIRTARGDPSRCELSIRDFGNGIPTPNLSKIFDSFFTTKRNGMGLGLSIARAIVEAHHGQIWAENCGDEGGSVLHVWLPIKAAS